MSDKSYGFITLNYYEVKPRPWLRPERQLRASFGRALEGETVEATVYTLLDQLEDCLEAEAESV